MRRKKTTVIIVMCVAIVLMAVGYAILSTRLTINGSTAVTSSWRVEFSAIRTTSTVGGATNAITPTVSATTAKFEVDLVLPGDEITYEIDITNYGDIVAEIKGATYEVSGSEAIYVKVGGIQKGTLIESCEGLDTCPTVTATVTIGYNASTTTDPEYKHKQLSITLDIGQYISSSPVESGDLIPELNTDFATKILNDNNVVPEVAGEGGTGLYYTSTNTQDNKPTYYFRGEVTNNYVSFAGFTWRIVRINEDGSVRLIKSSSISTTSAFNQSYGDNAYVGYMYGTAESTGSYEATHANNSLSTVLNNTLAVWYSSNLSDYTSYMSTEAGFCNDRSLYSGAGWYNRPSYYGAYGRLYDSETVSPQFACPQPDNDLFTTPSSSIGNKAFVLPIGLITADEIVKSSSLDNYSWNPTGDVYAMSINSYIMKNSAGWTMTPWGFQSSSAYVMLFVQGMLLYDVTSSVYPVYPVINIRGDVEVQPGTNGTEDNPYIIK